MFWVSLLTWKLAILAIGYFSEDACLDCLDRKANLDWSPFEVGGCHQSSWMKPCQSSYKPVGYDFQTGVVESGDVVEVITRQGNALLCIYQRLLQPQEGFVGFQLGIAIIPLASGPATPGGVA